MLQIVYNLPFYIFAKTYRSVQGGVYHCSDDNNVDDDDDDNI